MGGGHLLLRCVRCCAATAACMHVGCRRPGRPPVPCALFSSPPRAAPGAGILNAEVPEFSGRVLAAIIADLQECLAAGRNHRAKQLLRFLGALHVVNAVPAGWLLGALGTLVDTALGVATTGLDPTGATWQPWTDFLVQLLLAALPWCGRDLAAAGPDDLAGTGGLPALLQRIEAYMAARPVAEDEALRPMYGARGEDDAAARSDSGGASFLGELWGAIRECSENAWEVQVRIAECAQRALGSHPCHATRPGSGPSCRLPRSVRCQWGLRLLRGLSAAGRARPLLWRARPSALPPPAAARLACVAPSCHRSRCLVVLGRGCGASQRHIYGYAGMARMYTRAWLPCGPGRMSLACLPAGDDSPPRALPGEAGGRQPREGAAAACCPRDARG